MLMADRRRALGRWLWISAVAGLLVYMNSVSYLLGDAEGDALMAFEASAILGYVGPLLPLLAALPFGTGFCADWQAHYASDMWLRAGRRRYLVSKCLCCALSGGLAAMGGMFLFLVLLNLKFPPDWTVPTVLDLSGVQTLLKDGGTRAFMLYYASRLALKFFAGAFWALSALAFSAFYPVVPLTLCAPLVLYRLSEELFIWLRAPDWLNFTLLESGVIECAPAVALGVGALVFLAGAAILSLIFILRAGRRLAHG